MSQSPSTFSHAPGGVEEKHVITRGAHARESHMMRAYFYPEEPREKQTTADLPRPGSGASVSITYWPDAQGGAGPLMTAEVEVAR